MEKRLWLNRYDQHVPHSINYLQKSIVDLLLDASKKYPDQICTIFNDKFLKYHEVHILSERLANQLIHLGMRKGDRVGIIFPNIPQFILAFFGILKAGGIVVAINPQYRKREIEEIINGSNIKIVFCLDSILSDLRDLKETTSLNKIIISRLNDAISLASMDIAQERNHRFSAYLDEFQLNNLLMNCQVNLEDNYPSYNDPAIYQYTGGTTGIPKAAIGLHRNLTANTKQFVVWCNLQEAQEVIMAAIPLYHVYGMVLALCLGIALGARIVLISNPRETEKILQSIQNYKVSFFPGVPSMYYAINHQPDVQNRIYDLRSIKACISGSAPLHSEIKQTFEKLTGGKLIEGYGLSEAPTATHCNPLYGMNKAGSIGLPLPDVDCRIVDLETGQEDVQNGEIGELIIQGPQVMQGYHAMQKETENVLRNGWLYTGDVVRIDEQGYFYLIDRKKFLIKVSGFQVWPNEVEKIIESHPLVKEAGVGGVPELEHGEKVIAWVVSEPGKLVSKEDIHNWCKQYLAAYKVPSEIIFLDELPRSTVGKILHWKLINRYLEETALSL